MKKVTKILIIVSLLFSIISMYTNVFATELKTKLDVIQEASETKALENDQGYITKTIVNSDESTGEVTIELKLLNNNNDTNVKKYGKTEIWIIDEEIKGDKVSTQKREYTKQLCKKILSEKENVKIGIIGAKGPDSPVKKGSENDAEYVSNLTDNYTTLENNWNNMNKENVSYATNHQAALRLASKSFSENVNKVVITLIDGVTHTGIGFDGMSSATEASARKNIKDKASAVKEEILKLKNLSVNFIVFREKYENYIYKYGNTISVDANEYIDEMYGTIDSPYSGKIYMIDDNNLQQIITEVVYEDISKNIQHPLNKVKIVDYFPEEIIENFDFEYVENPSVGKVTEEIDLENKTIEWDIDSLKGDEVATLQYKLKIKDMKNDELLNKVISTNEKVVLTYQDIDAKEYTVDLTSSPKISLTEIKDENNNQNNNNNNDNNVVTDNSGNNNGTDKTTIKDKTTADGKIPQTGESMLIGISIVAVIIGTVCIYIKSRRYRDI